MCIDLSLINNLRTLDAFVYDVQLDIDLDTFEKMGVMEQMSSLLSNPGDLLHDIRLDKWSIKNIIVML